jgi:hypothetical protein
MTVSSTKINGIQNLQSNESEAIKLIFNRLFNALALTHSLISTLSPHQLLLKIPNCKSNTFASQIWCIIGAREMALNSIGLDKQVEFECSLLQLYQRIYRN